MKNRTCCFCGTGLPNGSAHIYHCKSAANGLSKSDIKYKYIIHNFPFFTKENLKRVYEAERSSLPDIKREYDIDYKSVIFLLERYGIKKRSISDSAKIISKQKFVETCKERYGVENVSQIKEVKEKKRTTFIRNHGVDNVWKSEAYKKWISEYLKDMWAGMDEDVKIKRLKPLQEGAKVFYDSLTPTEKVEFAKKIGFGEESSIEKAVRLCLSDLRISFEPQFSIGRYMYDFHLKGTDVLIEVNGDFWHANPLIYEGNDVLNFPGQKTTAKDIWKKDEKKQLTAKENGYQVVFLWESDINTWSEFELKTELLNIVSDAYER